MANEVTGSKKGEDHVRGEPPRDREPATLPPECREVIMGLHWTPPRPGEAPANLDALCAMLDQGDRVIDVVHPGRPRNHNGSVLHTGDSPTGASVWDDERIFVFLEAIPENVRALVFCVASADGRPLGGVPGASCHVSDRITEHEWIRFDLTALGASTAHCAATLRREGGIWRILPGATDVNGAARAEIMRLGGRGWRGGAQP